jgi:serine/threonine protein kinase
MEKQALAGRYAVGERIGAGGMADVFTARDTRLERDVAIKIFRPGTADGLERGSAEARMLAGLDHPGLVRVLDMDSGEHADGAYLVMELVDGPDLRDLLKAGGPLGQEDVRIMALDLARTLQYIHGRGIVHRDIKPSNILTRQADPESGLFRYLLTDFGIARFFDGTRVTATGQVIGSAAYFSPEQTRGDGVGQPSDIYSLGLVIIEALTGDRVFPGTGVESALARLHRSPSIPHAAGPALSALLVSMTLDEPGDRPDAAQVVRALTAMGPQRHDYGTTTVLPVTEASTAAMPVFGRTVPTTALPTTALPASGIPRPVPQGAAVSQDDATRMSDVASHASPDRATRLSNVDADADADPGATAFAASPPLDRPSVRPSSPISAERPLPSGRSEPDAADAANPARPSSPAPRDAPPRGTAARGRRRRSIWLLAVLAVVVLAVALWVVVLQTGGDPAVEPLPAVPGETGQRLQELYESVTP